MILERMEILTGVERQRRWSPKGKLRICGKLRRLDHRSVLWPCRYTSAHHGSINGVGPLVREGFALSLGPWSNRSLTVAVALP